MKSHLGAEGAGSTWGAEPNHLTHQNKLEVTLHEDRFKQHMAILSNDSVSTKINPQH